MTLADEVRDSPTLLRPSNTPEWTVVCGFCPRDVDAEETAENSGELVMHVFAADANVAAEQVDQLINGMIEFDCYCWPIVIFSGHHEPVDFSFTGKV